LLEPIIIVFSIYRSDKAHYGIVVRKDSRSVGAPVNLSTEPFGGDVRLYLRPLRFRRHRNTEMFSRNPSN